jgi:dihydrofolate reductase
MRELVVIEFTTLDGVVQAPGHGPIVVPGSGQLVHALTAANLVDRYQVWIHPVAVGSGNGCSPNPYLSA